MYRLKETQNKNIKNNKPKTNQTIQKYRIK
jgi:hypothetical protein